MRKFHLFLYGFIFTVLTIAVFVIGCSGGGSDSGTPTACLSGTFECGCNGLGPSGGPACCQSGYACCFHYNLCCPNGKQHLGQNPDGTKSCYESLTGEGSTWTLLTVCGQPVCS